MKDGIIKSIQKFINSPFTYKDLLAMLDKQKDFILEKNVIEKIDDHTYNAIWDTILMLENHFSFANSEKYVIASEVSVSKIFDYNLKCRTKTKQYGVNS